jgi:glycerol-1-phosphate dehydrogenase [NAD(P)+]
VEAGCLNRAEEYLKEYDLTGFRVVVYDSNTCHAEGMVRIPADLEVILDAEGLHADEHGVARLMEKLPEEAGVLVAVGSGTIHDITRYCAYVKKIPFVSCPTAASVDGFCSSVAAMTWEGAKRTLTAVAPVLVLADLNVISKAPLYLARSGFGDVVGKYIALTDWRIAHALTGEFYCQRIADITEEATKAVFENGKIRLNVTFTTPVFPNDYRLLTRPVSYMALSYESIDGASHQVTARVIACEELCLNKPGDSPVMTEACGAGDAGCALGGRPQAGADPAERRGDLSHRSGQGMPLRQALPPCLRGLQGQCSGAEGSFSRPFRGLPSDPSGLSVPLRTGGRL